MSHTRSRWKWFGKGGFHYRVERSKEGQVNIAVPAPTKMQLEDQGVDISRLNNIGGRSAWKVLSKIFK